MLELRNLFRRKQGSEGADFDRWHMFTSSGLVFFKVRSPGKAMKTRCRSAEIVLQKQVPERPCIYETLVGRTGGQITSQVAYVIFVILKSHDFFL